MITHKRIHGGENLFQECGRASTRKCELAAHKRFHTNAKPYKSIDCGKAFASNNYLASHKLIRIDEKSFECEECGNAFSQIKNLAAHKRIHKKEVHPIKFVMFENCVFSFHSSHLPHFHI